MTHVQIKADFIALADDYNGKWVAINPASGEVVASGLTAKEVLDRALEVDVQRPLLAKISDDYGAHILCLA